MSVKLRTKKPPFSRWGAAQKGVIVAPTLGTRSGMTTTTTVADIPIQRLFQKKTHTVLALNGAPTGKIEDQMREIETRLSRSVQLREIEARMARIVTSEVAARWMDNPSNFLRGATPRQIIERGEAGRVEEAIVALEWGHYV